MSESALRTCQNLMHVIANDPGIVALAKAEMGLDAGATALNIVRGNEDVTLLKTSELPCVMGELGDGSNEPAVIGGGAQDHEADFPFALIWMQQDRETAVQTRLKLVDLVPLALQANMSLDINDGNGDACQGIWVNGSTSSRGHPAQRPKQWQQFNAHAQWQA